ncbi:MAG: hypothetical protein QOJ84_3518 [Bradyrhizobium sp.]|jgi:hypothetical protein|nr:hypothetical protein [Bradyrhizobium sp.]
MLRIHHRYQTTVEHSIGNGEVDSSNPVSLASGRHVLIEKIRGLHRCHGRLQVAMTSEFFVDRIFRFSQSLRCQPLGVKAEGLPCSTARVSGGR